MNLCKMVSFFIGITCFSSLLVSCNSNSSPNPVKPVPVKTELEGSWVGKNTDAIDQTEWTYTMTLDSIVILASAQEKYRGSFSLDTTFSPRHIDITVTKSALTSDIGKIIPALYVISGGNIIRITANAPGSARPANMVDPVPVLSLILNN